jgi:hypothetical protein
MRRAIAGLALLTAIGCSGAPEPTAVPSTTPQPTPALTAASTAQASATSCWIGRGSYQLVIDGSVPTPGELRGAAQIVTTRLTVAGLRGFEVSQEPPDRLHVAYGQAGNLGLMRDLTTASGEVEFVPVPAGEEIEPGTIVDEGWQPLFDGSGVTRAAPGVAPGAQATVDLQLTDAAGALLDQWARGNVGSQLAVVVDGRAIVAPSMNAREFGGQMQISGGPELLLLAVLLGQPPMPGRLEELSFGEMTPSPDCPD